MLNVLDHQLELFDRDARSDAWRDEAQWESLCRELDRIMAFGIFVMGQLDEAAEKAQLPGAWSEEVARRMVPLYTQWQGAARDVLETGRMFKRKGYISPRLGEFVHAFNHSKLWVEFDETMESHRQFERGERGRTIQEIADELQAGDDDRGR